MMARFKQFLLCSHWTFSVLNVDGGGGGEGLGGLNNQGKDKLMEGVT